MAIDRIHLRKLLCLFGADAALRTRILRADIRSVLAKEEGKEAKGGGDFHTPFWADAKEHVFGRSDLAVSTEARVANNSTRRRLYPLLKKAFLKWWNERRRWRNEAFDPLPKPILARHPFAGSGTVKIEGLLGVGIGRGSGRYVYPYFAEEPPLSEEHARLGLWLMSEALPQYRLEDFRILDVLRSKSFSLGDLPLQGDERFAFARKYTEITETWSSLRATY
jgi:hypothetical protein